MLIYTYILGWEDVPWGRDLREWLSARASKAAQQPRVAKQPSKHAPQRSKARTWGSNEKLVNKDEAIIEDVWGGEGRLQRLAEREARQVVSRRQALTAERELKAESELSGEDARNSSLLATSATRARKPAHKTSIVPCTAASRLDEPRLRLKRAEGAGKHNIREGVCSMNKENEREKETETETETAPACAQERDLCSEARRSEREERAGVGRGGARHRGGVSRIEALLNARAEQLRNTTLKEGDVRAPGAGGSCEPLCVTRPPSMRDTAAGQQQARGEKLREAREEAGRGVAERMGVRAGESAAVGSRSGNPVWKALLQEDAAGAVRERGGREVQKVTEAGEKLAGSSSASVGGDARGVRRKVERRKTGEVLRDAASQVLHCGAEHDGGAAGVQVRCSAEAACARCRLVEEGYWGDMWSSVLEMMSQQTGQVAHTLVA
jgi:hypothetical protein